MLTVFTEKVVVVIKKELRIEKKATCFFYIWIARGGANLNLITVYLVHVNAK